MLANLRSGARLLQMRWISKLCRLLAIGGGAPTGLDLGDELPAIESVNQEGLEFQLSGSGATGFLLVYFFPKADTPGCTKQSCGLRDSYAVLQEMGVTVIGVSTDRIDKQKSFREKYRLPFELLADVDGTVLAAFGVPKIMGFAKRQAFLFKDGRLVWKDLAASADRQADDVLRAIDELRTPA